MTPHWSDNVNPGSPRAHTRPHASKSQRRFARPKVEILENRVVPSAVMVKDINLITGSSGPQFFANLHGTVLFAANDGVNGFELWKSDGSAAGTTLVKDINPGPLGSNLQHLTTSGDAVYF